MIIKNVTIAGAGTLGSQVAWQTALNGFNVTVYDAFQASLETGKNLHKQYAELFISSRGASQQEIDQTLARLIYTTNLAEAVKVADIINESIPESVEIKTAFYRELAKVAPQKTIFTTNSSTFLPSDFAEATGRPERFLALHFGNPVWFSRIGEIMGHPATDPAIIEQVTEFSKAIGMVPIPIRKEKNGYIINAILIPWLNASVDLVVNGVADPEDIDKTWMLANDVPMGPFAILDKLGLELGYDINKLWGEKRNDQAALARADFYRTNRAYPVSSQAYYM